MVYIPPPQIAGDRPSYREAYNKIISDHRRDPLASASSVTMLVAPNVDALCASRMLATLFKQDDVGYRIIPVSGREELEDIKEDLRSNTGLHTLILIDMGGRYDLPLEMWFGDFDLKVSIHVIDSSRPYSLVNLFQGGENGERVIIWDDGDSDQLQELKKSWEVVEYELKPGSDDEDDDDDDEPDEDPDGNYDEEEDEHGGETDNNLGSPSNKRRMIGGNASRKRRRMNDSLGKRMSAEDYEFHNQKVEKHYTSGSWYGHSVAGAIYLLATALERVDNDFLWLAIMGLTFQYITSRISREMYEGYQVVFSDEVSRLNPQPTQSENAHSLLSINPDDISVRSSEELRFMLFRHWTLYDAMYHSSYVASKLGIWKEKGRQRLTGLLAKMGFSIPQTQQPYSHMDMDLKKSLIQKLNDIAPEYGLVELSYSSFLRCYGFHTQPLSAADAVEGISALLDIAEGIRMEVEVEGSRNGGEWFGGGRVWEVRSLEQEDSTKKALNESSAKSNGEITVTNNAELQDANEIQPQEPHWWVKNFWTAYDALSDISALRRSLGLSMSLQRAIIRTGTSIIDRQEIRTMRSHRVVVLVQGPDLALFSHPGVLTKLALWLVDAMRDRLPVAANAPRSKRSSLPFVVACLNEAKHRYTVVGITASLDFGQVRKNQFALAFFKAMDKCEADVQFNTFDASVLEIDQKDLKVFLESLCE